MLNLYATPRHLPINQRLKTNTSKPPTPKQNKQIPVVVRSIKKRSHSKSKSLTQMNTSLRKCYESVTNYEERTAVTDRQRQPLEVVQSTRKIAIKIATKIPGKGTPKSRQETSRGRDQPISERKTGSREKNKTLQIEDIILQSPYFKQKEGQQAARIMFFRPS